MSGAKINLILGSHAHVPCGAPEQEFESAYVNIIKPFVSNLYKYPKTQAVLHYSGVLLHWVERSHPELLMLIEDMISRKQVEVMGGGFYEPILPLISLQDKIGQIEFLTTYLRKHFGKRPQGCWIPALAWEQNLVSPVAACGINYTFLSEKQFAQAGMTGNELFFPCLCEDQGKLITVFPLSQSINASLADKNINAVLEELKNNRTGEQETVVSIFPERLRAEPVESPDYTWHGFFEDLSVCEPFVESALPGKLIKSLKGLKKASFPDSLGSGEAGRTPRRFLVEHPEANGIYSKMIFTNLLINQLRGDKSRKSSAREELWKAQSCKLFHSEKQGLYRHSLRSAAYSALLTAERITREKTKFVPSLAAYDFNFDNIEEYLFQDVKINCYIQSMGGGIFELDYLPKAWNYLNTCDGRLAFADRLLPAAINLEDLPCGPVTGGRLCRNEPYEVLNTDKARRELSLKLAAAPSLPFGLIEIEKTYTLRKDTITVNYSLSNQGTAKETFQFAPEIDLSFHGEGEHFVRYFTAKPGDKDTPFSGGVARGVESVKIHDIKNEVQIILSSTQPFDGRIAAVRISGADKESQYQANCIMPLLPITLESGKTWAAEFNLKFLH